ncbi:DsbA family protein [Flavimaricola marinus]|uniref:DSBA-like thioredoxin domain protein n=1 Tax=Flavimaricola marinus TaxID=1819565 RepID=A0A238L981_9RHOB|nr:DsbA family protein [Flavimaricola marinus]SMY06133.1 DSBA-like thioredoxin domain protein [Flavimaricola marinus]
MTQTLHYLFDPLCGWCYGASATIATLSKHPDIDLKPHATGLFAGGGARPMKSFAAQAWANDQRIAALSGQQFTQAYRRDVLGAEDASLDSTVATLAVTAVADTAPDRVIEALARIQAARYVDGKDVTSSAVVADLLAELGLKEASARVLEPDTALLDLVRNRTTEARTLMTAFGLQGVPALIAEIDGTSRGMDASTLYSGPDAVLSALGLA